jgi:cyclic beta-1,2-glucan synthetase
VRGDWQLLPWIFGFRRTARDGSRKTPLPLMGRWKLLDNLRRSLSAPAALLAMLIGWLLPMPAAAIWTAYILLTIALPPLLPALSGIVPRRAGVSLRNHLRTLRGDFALGLCRARSSSPSSRIRPGSWSMRWCARCSACSSPASPARMGDGRADDRRFPVRPSRLTPADHGEPGLRRRCRGPVLFLGLRSWPIAAPFVFLWALSPLVARWASLPPPRPVICRSRRRTPWRSGWSRGAPGASSKNSSPRKTTCSRPIIFRRIPKPVIAHRTSPTNLGLYLLSVIAARDFGWLGTLGALERLEGTFATMAKLERFRGHFYNWYDTSDLRALEPKYVSSVDSGNLAGHLIALGNACHEIAASPIGNQNWISGLNDTIALLREAARPQTEERAPRAGHAS